jgi:hypothetical protein
MKAYLAEEAAEFPENTAYAALVANPQHSLPYARQVCDKQPVLSGRSCLVDEVRRFSLRFLS